MPIEKSAGAIIFKRDKGVKYLLLHYKFKTEYFGFPRGNIEEGESAEETALREIKEETGLDVELIEGFEEKINWFYKREGKTIYKEVVYFLAEAKGEVKISKEHIGYAWLSFEEAMEKLERFKSLQGVLKKANKVLNK